MGEYAKFVNAMHTRINILPFNVATFFGLVWFFVFVFFWGGGVSNHKQPNALYFTSHLNAKFTE